MRPAFKLITLPLCGLVVAIGLGEWLVATFAPQPTLAVQMRNSPACGRPSDLLATELKRSATCRHVQEEFDVTIHTNSLGYRGPEFAPQKDLSRKRILTVGDSFTFGHGVNDDETYSAELQRLFQGKAEVINGGYASGFSPDAYYLYLKNLGVQLRPDIVVMGFFIWNDVSDLSETAWPSVDENGLPTRIVSRLRAVDEVGRFRLVKQGIRHRFIVLRNSHLFQLVYSFRPQLFGPLDLLDSRPGLDPGRELASIYTTCLFIDECFFGRYASEWDKTQQVLIATQDLLRHNGIEFLVVLIPAKLQFAASETLDQTQQLSVNRRLIEFFEHYGIAYLDLYEALKKFDLGTVYYRFDEHWTAKGHAVAGRDIFDYLVARFGA